ncbi:MAG: hypothetical protein M0R49_01120 [Limnochordia bacterium]|jgi:hypothetical protein|nr:hypothetical protein [Limnochordia bacterium]
MAQPEFFELARAGKRQLKCAYCGPKKIDRGELYFVHQYWNGMPFPKQEKICMNCAKHLTSPVVKQRLCDILLAISGLEEQIEGVEK